MSQWDKLIKKLKNSPQSMRYNDLKKILENYGYVAKETSGGSSHVTFRKDGCTPVTIPRHEPILKIYVEMVREVVEKEDL